MTTTMPLADLRRDLIDALPADVAQESEEIPATQLYLPWSHARALRLESSLVIGARGVGKSVWSQTLQDPEQRKILPDNLFPYRLQVSPGFGTAFKHNNYPDPETFENMLSKGNCQPYDIWRAVLCRALATTIPEDRPQPIPTGSWQDTVDWVMAHGEEVAALIEQADNWLQEHNKGFLLVFDALDRVSITGRWRIVDQAIRDLLRLALQLKASRRLHAKVFLRTDQYERGNFADIPDLSKLQATRWNSSGPRLTCTACSGNGSQTPPPILPHGVASEPGVTMPPLVNAPCWICWNPIRSPAIPRQQSAKVSVGRCPGWSSRTINSKEPSLKSWPATGWARTTAAACPTSGL